MFYQSELFLIPMLVATIPNGFDMFIINYIMNIIHIVYYFIFIIPITTLFYFLLFLIAYDNHITKQV